jgi:predicted ArsR family transcriptional regulator
MDRLAALGDRELRAALSYVLAQARPVTADELSRSQRTHRNVARSRLERLAMPAWSLAATNAGPAEQAPARGGRRRPTRSRRR